MAALQNSRLNFLTPQHDRTGEDGNLITLDRFWQASIMGTHLAVRAASKSVKLQRPAGATVQSLHMGRDRQCTSILIECPLPKLVKTARPMGRSNAKLWRCCPWLLHSRPRPALIANLLRLRW
jgi:hypothetical protein